MSLAKERYGVKLLYHYTTDGAIFLAPEINAVIKSGLSTPSLDQKALVEYPTFQHLSTHQALIRNVKRLMPGRPPYIEVSEKTNKHRCWDFNLTGVIKISKPKAAEKTSGLNT